MNFSFIRVEKHWVDVPPHVIMPTRLKQLWVMPHEIGWQAKHAGAQRSAFTASTKAEVIDRARKMARKHHDELIITDMHNVIQDKDSHGRDPRSIPG